MKVILIFAILLMNCSDNNELPQNTVDVSQRDFSNDISLDQTQPTDVSVDSDTQEIVDATKDTDLATQPSNALSIDQVKLSLNASEASIPLMTSNALPFLTVSYKLGDPTLRYLHVDVAIEDEELLLSRFGAPLTPEESISISGQIVGFDPSRIRVQCQAFQTGRESVKINIEEVQPETTFINFWSKIATGSNNKDVAFLSARFESNNEIILARLSPAGTINGHLCLSESVGDTFSVQHLDSQISEGETEVLIPIENVDLERSIVFASHQATRTEAKPGYSQISCELQSSAVRCIRCLNENGILDLRIQVVSFKERTKVSRFRVVIEDGDKESRIDLPGYDTSSVILGPIGVLGEVSTTGTEKEDVPSSHVEAVVDADGILFRRGEPFTGRLEFFPQVVRW